MTKIESMIISTDWAIEREMQKMEQSRESIKDRIYSDHMEHDAMWILQYAENMSEAAKKLAQLREQRDMLVYLSEKE